MKGIKLINLVIFKFTKLINQLEKGIELINKEQDENDDTIGSLHTTIATLEQENIRLETPKETARNVINNLRKLLGETNE